jgi:steroid delta-isomerase-like uncharacterized protein
MTSEIVMMESNKKIVHRFIEECWNKGDLSKAPELMAANCRFHDPVFPHLAAGTENMRRHIESCRKGFPDLRFTIDDTIAERNEVVLHWTINGTQKGEFLGIPATNKKAMVTGTSIFRVENGKITEEWANWNLMSLMEQLGVATAPVETVNAPKARA